MSPYNKVHPDLLIARSRRWTRSAIAATGAATLGLTGWIAFSTQTASARTTQSTTNGTPTTHKTHHKRRAAAAPNSTTPSNSGTSSNYTPTTSNNVSTPIQGTTSGS